MVTGANGCFGPLAFRQGSSRAAANGQKQPYVTAFEDDKADAYVMYCTNAASTLRALPQLAVVHIPDGVNVRSAYGTGARAGSAAGALSRSCSARRAAASCLRTGSINAPP
jgi:hypothetical protein